jgi:hypothetical protein
VGLGEENGAGLQQETEQPGAAEPQRAVNHITEPRHTANAPYLGTLT